MLSPQSDEERLAKYFRQLERDFPYVTERDVKDALVRPCKYSKILEERKNNPDATG
jgi:hypothetical protein